MNDLFPLIAIGAVTIGAALLVFLVFASLPQKAAVRELLEPTQVQVRRQEDTRSFSERVADTLPNGYTGWVQRQIIYAGRTGSWSVGGFVLLKIFVTALGLLIGIGALLVAPNPLMIGGGVVLMLLFLVAPEIMLNSRADDRQTEIQRALPDTLDQMTIAVEAGLGFEGAMAKAAQGGTGPLNDELIRTLQDMTIGRSRSDAYTALLARTNSEDLRRFVRAIQQADRYGISIADVLRVQASEMRVKRRARAEESAMKIPIKVVFPLVFAILPVLFIVLLFPAVVGIIDAFS
ncbi:type II secretion system protein [Agromyces rhizosphaerae]|uniref:Type II secretion system protein n=1 Tax=Agromyces rhizosphaerae TaxID=88374 RepID=A0A9W6CX46_9MICO|nr:type II secretion system F family protein [Agromyces rhizosphaerae]GLI26842.1 type II secretion system protein [Agromyces rhizosphaerae]